MTNRLKIFLLLGLLAIMCAIILLLSSIKNTQNSNKKDKTALPTNVPYKTFSVVGTLPQDGATNVSSGEIVITFTSSEPITSPDEVSVYFSPPLDNPPKLVSAFPTQQLTYQVLGGLKQKTAYTVSVRDKNNVLIYSWAFTTSDIKPQSSSGLVKEQQDQLNKDYYPLFNFVPYSNADFSIDYTARLTVLVKIKKNNIEAIKKEANDWILQKGVNPQTHTIKYESDF